MYLLVGLGNPGEKYYNTRHNIGALMLEKLLPDITLKADKNLNSIKGEFILNNNKAIVIFPQTFMNLSGDAVFKAVKYYNIKIENIIVFHDEIDLEPGKVVYKFDGGHRGHNGLRDIISKLNGANFHRIRIGVGRPVHGSVADYVLSKIPENEFPEICDIENILNQNIFKDN